MKRIIPLLLVLIILAVGVAFLLSAEREESNNMRELYQQTEPLQRQKDELTAQKAALSESFRVETRDPSTVQVLFRETNVKLFTHVYPLMRDRGIKGVIGISTEDFPGVGLRDKISAEHFNRLMMDGWGSCIVYDSSLSLETYLRTMKDILDFHQISMPTTIYLTEKYNSYDSVTMDPIMQKYGITTVVRNASDGHSDTVSDVGDIWHTGAMPWNYTGVNTDLELLGTTDGGNLTLTASFNDIWDGMMQEQVTLSNGRLSEPAVQEAFISFLDVLESMLGRDSSLLSVTPSPSPSPTPGVNGEIPMALVLRSTDFEDARESHLKAQTSNDNHLAEYMQMQADLDRQIAELDQQIADIYTAFNIKGASSNKSGSGETA